MPRFAATCSADRMLCNPSIVARITLMGLFDPIHFASTSLTPTTSNTARMGPPAIIPVPSDAGCMKTRAAPCRAITAYCRVEPCNEIFTRFLRALSIAFCIAAGTSLALPRPIPTRPLPSPTTVKAVNPNKRPPFTTLATRLIATSFSNRSSSPAVFWYPAILLTPPSIPHTRAPSKLLSRISIQRSAPHQPTP